MFKELTNAYNKWFERFKRKALEAVQKPRFEWTVAKFEEFKSVPVEDLIMKDYFLGLKDEIYPAHLDELIEMFHWWRDNKIDEIIDISAVGVGKTLKASAWAWLTTFDTLIHPEPATMYGLAPRSRLALAVISRNQKLAKEVTFTQMLPFFDCGFFTDYFPPQVNISLVEESRKYPAALRFPKRFAIFPGTGSATAILGFNVIHAVIDEFAWMEKIARSLRAAIGFGTTEYDAAFEVYNAVDTRVFSRVYGGHRKGTIFMITSPRTKYDFAEKKYKQGAKNIVRLRRGESLDPPKLTTDQAKQLLSLNYAKDEAPKRIIALKRKAMWRARPFNWKGHKQWSGEYLLFDTKSLTFVSEEIHTGLFDSDDDYTPNGYLKVPTEVATRFVENPQRSLRDIAAVPTAGIHRFFQNLALIIMKFSLRNYMNTIDTRLILKEDYKPSSHAHPTERRYGHCDLAKNRDVAAAALCYVSGWKASPDRQYRLPIARYDWLTEIYPESAVSDIQFDRVLKLFTESQARGFDIGLVSYDGFQSVHSIQTLWNTYGIPAGRVSIDYTAGRLIRAGVDDNSEYGAYTRGLTNQPLAAWEAFRSAWYDGRIECPPYERESCSLYSMFEQEEFYSEAYAGKGKVDHPPGGKHDLLQAMVGAYWNLLNNEWWIISQVEYQEDQSMLGEPKASPELEDAIEKADFTPEEFEKMGV